MSCDKILQLFYDAKHLGIRHIVDKVIVMEPDDFFRIMEAEKIDWHTYKNAEMRSFVAETNPFDDGIIIRTIFKKRGLLQWGKRKGS